ncbi:MAG: amidase [Vicinamibacterales bacterium]
MSVRHLLIALAVLVPAGCTAASDQPPAAAPAPVVDVIELGAADARQQLDAGTLTSKALTEAYLARIAAIDDAGPSLNSVIELNPAAVADAERLDAERSAGRVRGPLHGLPVLLKDNIDVVGMVNSGGSLALAENRPTQDAFLVTRLREAGAVILGKTNLSEWANFRSTRSTSGWSSRGGQTRNPYALDRNPCGSSSGTGTAIAASLAAVGIGTETDGSILCPASVAGLVGLKPTVGLVSRSGIIPISISQDTAGPMTRTVTDAALLLSAIAAVDAADPAGPAAEGRTADYVAALRADALAGKRFGVVRQAMGYHPGVDQRMAAAIEALTAAGATVVDVKVPTYDAWSRAEFEVLLYEFKDGLNAYLARAGSPHASLEALIAWNAANRDRVMPFFGQEIFEQAQAKGPLTDAAYLRARAEARRLAGPAGLIATLDGQRLDALIAPAMAPAWPTDHVLGDHFIGAGYGMAAVAGTPSLTVPMGDVQGLPVGLAFMGRPYAEADLLAFGYAFEQKTRARTAPTSAPTLPD